MTKGRPPKPTELKRVTGNPGQRKLPELHAVTPLPMAENIPAPPPDLGVDGRQVWDSCWSMAITWLSPDSDHQAILNVCRLADDLAVARRRYHATSEAVDARALASLNKSFTDGLTSLGFDPVSRSRLGVAEVKRVSALDQLIAKRQQGN